jgi:hypothetical protein
MDTYVATDHLGMQLGTGAHSATTPLREWEPVSSPARSNPTLLVVAETATTQDAGNVEGLDGAGL